MNIVCRPGKRHNIPHPKVNKASTKKEVYLSLNMTQDFGNHHTCQFDTTSSTAHSLHDYHESFLKIPLASSEVYHSKQAILLRARFSNGFLKRKHRFVTQKFIKIHSFCFHSCKIFYSGRMASFIAAVKDACCSIIVVVNVNYPNCSGSVATVRPEGRTLANTSNL